MAVGDRWTIPYTMAEQRCLMCNTAIPFIPFKDPICEECCKPVQPRKQLTPIAHPGGGL